MSDKEVSDEMVVESPSTSSMISEQDKKVLDMVKMRVTLAKANAEKALAQNEAAESNYQVVTMQLAMKYKLNEGDEIKEDGTIVRK